ncbi:MAG: acetylxylan esterase [Verrucomicrobia bacterium]|nr:acetylxylan esterase [Verrucomicrobiota bacterium]
MNALLHASLTGLAVLIQAAAATNYDESKVPPYRLPELLAAEDGTRVTHEADWRNRRRPELLSLFEKHIYGTAPGRPATLSWKTGLTDTNALGGLATRKEIAVFLDGRPDGPRLDLLLYLPNGAVSPAPAFLGLNYYGNQSVHSDPRITASSRWMRPARKMGIENHRATEATRGKHASRWPLERALSRGYAVATYYYGDIEPDHRDGWKDGIRGFYASKSGRDPGPEDWGAIAAWAWGLSRSLDVLESEPRIDSKKVVVFGHSRHGKTALWAGARDERFAITISNDSGEGGASLARREYGERVRDLVRAVPYWFCGNYARFTDQEHQMPVDAHQLIALTAPRPAYVASATEDRWADPLGEFLAAVHASPAWRLFGKTGLVETNPPAPDQSVGASVGYHQRTGAHDITAFDWKLFLDFADRHFGRTSK